MKRKSVTLKVSPSIGSVSGEYIIPVNSTCLITIAHGAGAGMHHPFLAALAASLADKGIATLRFNFPFTEKGKGRPDSPAVAHQAIEAAIRHARKKYAALPLFISGKSFGGRMSSQYLAAHHDADAKGIIFYGFPLHAPGKPSIERGEHLKDLIHPMLFLSGTRDEFATLNLLKKVCKALPEATLITIEGANHSFKAGKLNTIEMLADYTREWTNEKLASVSVSI
jgi:predicted alpha/beta-hydrolase family hydrolase